MNDQTKNKELTEEQFLELVLEEQEKALAKAREERLLSMKKPKKQKPIIRLVIWFMSLTLLFNTFAVILNVYSIPAIEFLKVSAKLSGQQSIQQYKKAVVTIQTDSSKGTGFSISEDGYILTNEHVIADALTVTVVFPDNKLFEAEVVEAYENYDLALLKVDGKSLPYLQLAQANDVSKREQVYFIGNPLAFSGIANEGTALGYTSASSIEPQVMMMNAPVYRGNSGSPVINKAGMVIGVVFATGKREPHGKVGLYIPIENVYKQFEYFNQ